MDAVVELPGMDLQRVTASNARFMSSMTDISLTSEDYTLDPSVCGLTATPR
jgi:hypothetical protein